MISCSYRETTSPGVLSVTPINSVSTILSTQTFLTFAQADPEAVEATPGNIIAALLVMSAMAGSLFMITIWWQRYVAGSSILPTATRKPLRVPLPLLIGGIVLAGMMALTVLLAAVIPKDMLPNPVDGDAAVVDVEQPVDAVAEVGAVAQAPDENNAVDDGGAVDDKVAKKAAMQNDFSEMLWQTLSINGIMFCIFGTFTYFAQLNQSRRSVAIDDVSYPAFGAVLSSQQSFSVAAAVDDPAEADRPFVDQQAAANPYSVPNPFADDETPTEVQIKAGPDPEPWSFSAEFRFACETFLVAYLPTSLLRILIVQILPDAPSHPFLEMLADGVDWNIMALIALMAVVVAPLVEELLYRVVVLGGIWQQNNLMVAWLVSSVLFSFAHGFPDSIALLPLALAIGYTYIQRRSYRTVVLVHFLFNGFNMAIAGAAML